MVFGTAIVRHCDSSFATGGGQRADHLGRATPRSCPLAELGPPGALRDVVFGTDISVDGCPAWVGGCSALMCPHRCSTGQGMRGRRVLDSGQCGTTPLDGRMLSRGLSSRRSIWCRMWRLLSIRRGACPAEDCWRASSTVAAPRSGRVAAGEGSPQLEQPRAVTQRGEQLAWFGSRRAVEQTCVPQ